MSDEQILKKVKERYQKSTGDNRACVSSMDIIVFLEKEIESYRDKIGNLESQIKEKEAAGVITELRRKLEAINETTLEAVQDNTVGEIIKALSNNGFNNISINAYKTKEE